MKAIVRTGITPKLFSNSKGVYSFSLKWKTMRNINKYEINREPLKLVVKGQNFPLLHLDLLSLHEPHETPPQNRFKNQCL